MGDKAYKIINISLIVLSILLGIETTLNILGRKALLEHDFAKAQKFLSLISSKELLGLVYYKQDNFEKAFNFYKDIKDWRGMGWAYYGMGKYDEAQNYFKRVDDLVGLGQVELAKGKYSLARDIFNKTEEKSGLGLTYLAYGDYEKAKVHFTEAGDYLGLGLTYFSKGDFSSAKKVFRKSKNKTVQGISKLIDGNMEEAKATFSKLNDTALLGGCLKFMGAYDEALKVFLKSQSNIEVGKIFFQIDDYLGARNMFSKENYFEGLGDVAYEVGDYEKAFQYYNKDGNYFKAYSSLLFAKKREQAIRYGKEILKKDSEQTALQIALIENLRLLEENENAEIEIDRILKIPGMAVTGNLLKARLHNNNEKVVKESLQQAIYQAGPGFLAKQLMLTARLNNLPLRPPKTEKISAMTTQDPLAFMRLLLIGMGCFYVLLIIVLMVLKNLKKEPELRSVQVGFGRVSSTHKIIYDDRTSLNLSTVEKIAEKVKTDPKFLESEEESVPDTEADSDDQIVSKGIKVLKMAISKLGIEVSAVELIELAGEETEKLTVYGIYLAARAKGIQVQGIKVDISYLKENQSIHLVFFQDENFAYLSSINDEQVELAFSPGESTVMAMNEFMEKWNGYVVSLSK